MAFWALYGKSWYRRKDIPNMIEWYKKYLYNEWFNSLSEQEQKAEKERVEEENRKREEWLAHFWRLYRSMEEFSKKYYS